MLAGPAESRREEAGPGLEVLTMPQKKKKGPPPRITRRQLIEAEERGKKQAAGYAMAIFFTVIADKFNGADWIPDIWREVLKLSESINQGYVDADDLARVLRKEYGITI